jgi:ribosomal protein L23
MVKIFFPTMFMRLISLDKNRVPAIAKLEVPPRMTKTDIREYLTKIYGVNVQKVDTVNLSGTISELCVVLF